MLLWGGGRCFSVLPWEDDCADDQQKEWETSELIAAVLSWAAQAAQLCLVGAFLPVYMTCSSLKTDGENILIGTGRFSFCLLGYGY